MVGVFHKIGEPTEDHYTHSIEQILNFDGQITFDGAYTSVWEHREELGPKQPIMFIQGETVGTEGVCNERQIADLSKAGFVIGWHGWTHRRLPELDDIEVLKELMRPPIIAPFYAYPHGDWDERTAQIVKDLNYKMAFSTTQGEEGNDFAIPRVYL